MPSKRESTQSSQASVKRQRATTSTSRVLSGLTASSSFISSSAIPPKDWENLVHNHFPGSYHHTSIKTNDRWRKYYIQTLKDAAKGLETPEEGQGIIRDIFIRIFSPENMDVNAHALNKDDKEVFLIQIIRALNNLPHVRNNRRLINLAALIHHRLPQDLASELFIKSVANYEENPALQGQETLTPIYWALICRQPITTKLIIQSPANERLKEKLLGIYHVATYLNDLEFIKTLRVHGVQIGQFGNSNNLEMAIKYGFPNIVNYFLTLPNKLRRYYKNELDTALLKGNIEILDLLIEKYNSTVEKDTLLKAAKFGNREIMRKILARSPSNSIEALEEAIGEEDSVSIDTLFEGGIHVKPDCQSEPITQELAIRAQMNSEILKNNSPQTECIHEDITIAFLKGNGPGLYSMPIGYTPDGIYFFEDALGGSDKAINFLIASDVKTPMVLKPFFHDKEDRLSYQFLALTIVSDRLARAGLPIALKEEEKADLCQGNLEFLNRIRSEYPTDILQEWLKGLSKAPETASIHIFCQKLIKQLEHIEFAELLKELDYLDAEPIENAETNSLSSSSQQSGYGPGRFFKSGIDKSSAENNEISSSNSSSPCSSSSSSGCSSIN